MRRITSRLESPHKISRATIAFITTLALAACHQPEHGVITRQEPTSSPAIKPLRPCYETSIQAQLPKSEETKLPPLKLQQNDAGVTRGDPGMLAPNIREKVSGAMVKFFDPFSTGFLLKPDLVVTSAHGVYTKNIRTIDLTDSKNNLGQVIDGCYIYETNGRQANPLDEKGAGIDIAVLRLAKPIGTSTLSLATTELHQGDWATFLNYQNRRPVDYPAEYNGVALADKPHIGGNILLTGIQAWRNCEPRRHAASECSIDNGASGGPLLGWATGDVFGISVRGTDAGRLNKTSMLEYGVVPQFDTEAGTGNMPRIAYTTGAHAIKLAVDALG